MMSGLVGFIAFPEGYTCSIFSAYKDKVPKSTSALGVQEPELDEGKLSIVMLIIIYDYIITCDVAWADISLISVFVFKI